MPAVVWIPGGEPSWELPPALPTDHGWLGGGRRTMHELAVAIACAGREVEMRGEFDEGVLRELSTAAGACPELPTGARAPAGSDVVFVYEGVDDPLAYAHLALSPARLVLMVLAPLGLFGWPFTADWSEPDPLTVETGSVARPEHFQAAATLGFELWTNSTGLQRAAQGAGVDCRFVGRGVPAPFPDPPARKDVDVLTLGNNRWAPLADQVAKELERLGVRPLRAPRVGHDELIGLLGRSRVFVHPMRVEGDSRLGLEARAMGAVPVTLDSTAYAAGLDEAHGAVTAESLQGLANAAAGLLADPSRLEGLAAAGMRWARSEVAWGPYVARVEAALATPSEDAGRPARAGIGAALREREAAELTEMRAELDRHRSWLTATNGSLSWRLTKPLRSARRLLRRRAPLTDAPPPRPPAGT